jgi:hypothetical protein
MGFLSTKAVILQHFHQSLYGIADVHSLRIEPHNRHGEGGLTEGNGAKACLAVNNAVNENGYPSVRPDKMEQRVNLIDFEFRFQGDASFLYERIKHTAGVHALGWCTDIIIGKLL